MGSLCAPMSSSMLFCLFQIRAATVTSSMGSPLHAPEAPIPPSQTKYLDLLARYYVLKRQHLLAANVLYRLAERQCSDAGEGPTLEQRSACELVLLLVGDLSYIVHFSMFSFFCNQATVPQQCSSAS